MKTKYENTCLDHPKFGQLRETKDDAVKPLGTFAGVVYKTPYRCGGAFVPSDTSEQLIADGLN